VGIAAAAAPRSVPPGHGWRWIVDAWSLTAGYRALFTGLVFGFLMLAVVSGLIPLIGSFLFALLAPVLQGGLMLGCEALRRGEPLKVDHLFAGFGRRTGQLLVLGVVSVGAGLLLLLIGAAIVGPGVFSMLLTGAVPDPAALVDLMLRALLAVLVIMALSLPLYMAMWFAVPLVVLGGLDVKAAMRQSFYGCLHNVVPFLVWSVALLALGLVIVAPLWLAIWSRVTLLMLVALLPMLVGSVMLGALVLACVYTSYRDVLAFEESGPDRG
jgi:hypothetical protein